MAITLTKVPWWLLTAPKPEDNNTVHGGGVSSQHDSSSPIVMELAGWSVPSLPGSGGKTETNKICEFLIVSMHEERIVATFPSGTLLSAVATILAPIRTFGPSGDETVICSMLKLTMLQLDTNNGTFWSNGSNVTLMKFSDSELVPAGMLYNTSTSTTWHLLTTENTCPGLTNKITNRNNKWRVLRIGDNLSIDYCWTIQLN